MQRIFLILHEASGTANAGQKHDRARQGKARQDKTSKLGQGGTASSSLCHPQHHVSHGWDEGSFHAHQQNHP